MCRIACESNFTCTLHPIKRSGKALIYGLYKRFQGRKPLFFYALHSRDAPFSFRTSTFQRPLELKNLFFAFAERFQYTGPNTPWHIELRLKTRELCF